MNNRNIKVKDYSRLQHVFNPISFNAAQWVTAAKSAGMKYIVFITRHHDGFSNWDTKYSDWKITNSPYGKDVLKQLADECKRQNIKLGLYYSTLDWYPIILPSTGIAAIILMKQAVPEKVPVVLKKAIMLLTCSL